MDLIENYLFTSDKRFGFKPKLSCAHALYAVRQVIDHLVLNDTPVNLCLVDVSKTF